MGFGQLGVTDSVIMNSASYQRVLEDNVSPSVLKPNRKWTFQQDKHTANPPRNGSERGNGA